VSDKFQIERDYSGSQYVLKEICLFLEKNLTSLDYREAYHNSERALAIGQIIWQYVCLPHAYLESKITYWAKRIYYLLYFNEVPIFFKEKCANEGLELANMDFDEAWMKNEEQFQGNNIYEDRKNQLNRQMAHRFTSSNKIVLGKDAYSGQNNYQIKLSNPNPDEKLKIFVGGDYEDRSFP